jgi:hypothetical protein
MRQIPDFTQHIEAPQLRTAAMPSQRAPVIAEKTDMQPEKIDHLVLCWNRCRKGLFG